MGLAWPAELAVASSNPRGDNHFNRERDHIAHGLSDHPPIALIRL